jgi:hypothetical protein
MGSKIPDSEFKQWIVEGVDRGDDVSLDVTIGLYENYDCVGRFRFQYNRTEDRVGAMYIPGRWGSSFDDKDAKRDNRAAFEAAQAVAEETRACAVMYVHSQEYLNKVSQESLSDLIGEIGEERVRELLTEEAEIQDNGE